MPPVLKPKLCPIHDVPMIFIGHTPSWSDRARTAATWHCPKCTIEIQAPPADATDTHRNADR